ncbi:MAG TPA: hypothetical protein VFL93_16000, partial [Longimicrobiaceae bacterium]|nr:hypothetical protein [Longimicrobiaceae bacterium]
MEEGSEARDAVGANSPLEQGLSTAVPPAAPEAGFGAKLRRLGSETLIYGLSSIVGRFLTYLLQPFYAHEFTPDINGIQAKV